MKGFVTQASVRLGLGTTLKRARQVWTGLCLWSDRILSDSVCSPPGPACSRPHFDYGGARYPGWCRAGIGQITGTTNGSVISPRATSPAVRMVKVRRVRLQDSERICRVPRERCPRANREGRAASCHQRSPAIAHRHSPSLAVSTHHQGSAVIAGERSSPTGFLSREPLQVLRAPERTHTATAAQPPPSRPHRAVGTASIRPSLPSRIIERGREPPPTLTSRPFLNTGEGALRPVDALERCDRAPTPVPRRVAEGSLRPSSANSTQGGQKSFSEVENCRSHRWTLYLKKRAQTRAFPAAPFTVPGSFRLLPSFSLHGAAGRIGGFRRTFHTVFCLGKHSHAVAHEDGLSHVCT